MTVGTTRLRTSPVSRGHERHDRGLVGRRGSARRACGRGGCFGFPPIQVSSATTRPESSPASGSRRIASRMRWSMYQAVFAVSLYLRSISRADTPFFDAHISKITKSHVRIGIARAVEDRAGEDRELLAASGALPHPPLRLRAGPGLPRRAVLRRQEVGLRSVVQCGGAHRLTVPAEFFKQLVGVRFGAEPVCQSSVIERSSIRSSFPLSAMGLSSHTSPKSLQT